MRTALLPCLPACLALAPADSARAGTGTDKVLEVVTFRLVPGVTDAQFLAAASGTEVALAAQPGFVRRTLLRDDTGLWTDAVEWQGLTLAVAAARAVMADPGFAPFGAAIDMTTLRMQHLPIVWQMGD